ncbi:MAG: extracellular solute-binding protein [Verrucomicrobia bacterium]|nr:extracellular solute-binding protein [Verrucomicrobiota bacterium]
MKRFFSVPMAFVALIGCKPGGGPFNSVVVYTSVDDVFARPICERFQRETGIEVKLVPDTEETKSTGLLNRLLAEKARPVADVFWSGDPARAGVLKARGISAPFKPASPADTTGRYSDPAGHWSALSARARVILYNTNLVAAGQEPRGLADFLKPEWHGRACLANPLFGTTSMHAAALFEVMGEAKAREFFTALKANGVKMLSSNGEVKRRVANGEFAFGLADTDDAHEAAADKKPVAAVYPDAEGGGTLVVPNAAVLIAGAPHPENGKRFIEFLLSAAVEAELAKSAAQMPLRPGVPVPSGVKRVEEVKTISVDYETLAARLEHVAAGFLKDWVNQQ